MPEGLEPSWGEGEESLENSIESEEWLFVKGDGGELSRLNSGELKAPGGRLGRESVVPFDSGESLFLGCRDDFGAADEASGTVVVEG